MKMKTSLVVERSLGAFVRDEDFVDSVNDTIVSLDVPCNDLRRSLVSAVD